MSANDWATVWCGLFWIAAIAATVIAAAWDKERWLRKREEQRKAERAREARHADPLGYYTTPTLRFLDGSGDE